MIRKLLPCQVQDPAKGSFMVKPVPVSGKKVQGLPVYRSSTHPDPIEFIVKPSYS